MIVHFVQRRKVWYGVSAFLFIAAITFVALGGLKFGIDFTGGSPAQIEVSGEGRPSSEDVQHIIEGLSFGGFQLQSVDESNYLIRTKQLTSEEHARLLSALQERYPEVKEASYSEVGPTIGKELRERALSAVLLVLLGIILYVSWAFRKSSGRISGWAFGVNAIIALLHDVVIVIGFFSFLGFIAHIEVDVLFVTALLTVLGFSVHDTIVVFDRIREG